MPKTTTQTRAKRTNGEEAFQYGLLSGLIAEVGELRAEIGALRDQLSTEVRTRRVTVVNERGHEGVVISANDLHSEVTVTSEQDETVWSSLHANDEDDPSSGLYLSGGDNGMGSFEVDTRVSRDDETTEYSTQLTIDGDHSDPRTRCISLNRKGLQLGGE